MIKAGLTAWWWQRLSAVYLALFTLVAVAVLIGRPPTDFEAWRGLVGQPAVAVAVGLYFVALLWHTWIGIRDVLMDYARHTGVRLTALAVVALWLWGCGLWLGSVLLRGLA